MGDIQKRLLRVNWAEQVASGPYGAPVLTPEWVADQGRGVCLVDVRRPDSFTGPLGHIPGSVRIDMAKASSILELGEDMPVVLVCNEGPGAATVAVYLRAMGMNYVAALDGGMRAWRSRGFTTSRSATGLSRTLADLLKPAPVPSGAITAEHVLEHLGDPGAVRWVKLASLMLHGKRSCVDGRDDHGVLGTPGGDAGEFMLALAALEAHTGQHVDEALPELLELYTETFGRFSMHSDINTWNTMILAMRADRRLDGMLPVEGTAEQWRAFMRNPPMESRTVLLEHFAVADHVGCGHLKLSYKNSDTYGVRPELMKAFIRAFWEASWAGMSELEHVTLGGSHGEEAVLSVVLDQSVWPFTQVPLISPMVGTRQVFVNHPQVAAYFRKQAARFFARHGYIAADDVEAFGAAMCELGDRQLTATLAALADGLPLFELRFSEDGSVRVA